MGLAEQISERTVSKLRVEAAIWKQQKMKKVN
jgi:hypothetical protein